jgi:hypothetical protein
MSKNSELLYQFKDAANRLALRIKEGDTKSILNPAFKYTPSSKTDIRETFKRAQKELNRPKNQDNNKPLVLNTDSFVLGVEWLDIKD